MKYSRILMTALLSVMLFCVACTENDKFKQDAVTPVLPMEDTKVDPLGDEWIVSYTTNASSWTISKEAEAGDTDWVICDTQSGKAGTTKVKITVLPNTTSSERKLTVKFGGDSQFKIYQNAALLEVGLKQEEKHPWLHPEKSFDVKSTLFWRIEGIDEQTKTWLEGIESGVIYEKDKNLSLNFTTNNYSDINNVATIRFVPVKKNYLGEEVPVEQQSEALRNAVDELTYEVIIIQEHIKFLVNYGEGKTALERFSEFGENMNPDGQSYVDEPYSQTVTVESETEWVIDESSKPEWISVDPGESSAPDDGIMYRDLKISVPGLNVDKEKEREGKVILKSKDDEKAFREIYVTQNSFQLSIKMTEDKEGNNEIDTFAVSPEGTAYLHVETRGPWKIKEDDLPDWLTVDPELMSGVGSPDPIPVSSDVWNLEFEKQDYDVTCTAEIQDKSDPSVTVTPSVKTVYKDPFVFEVGENLIDGQSAQKVLAAIPRKSTKTYDLQVNCSGPWKMEFEGEGKEEDWLEVSVFEAEGNHTMSVGAKDENTSDTRSKYLKFTSSVHKEHDIDCDITLEVTQDMYIFNMFKVGTEYEDPKYDNVPAYHPTDTIYKVKLECGEVWSLNCDDGVSVKNALGADVSSGDGDTYPILYVHVETNIKEESVDKYVTVKSEFNGGETKQIQISQDAFVFNVDTKNIPTGNIAYDSQGTYTVDVKSTAEAEWEVQKLDDNSNWVAYTTPASYKGNKTGLEFKVSQNGNTGPARQANFAVYNKISRESLPFTFTQEAYIWNVKASDPDPFNEINANNSAYSFKVKCSDAWKITGVPDWLSVSPTEDGAGLDEKTVTIEPVSDNLSLEKDREATLKIDGTFAKVEHKEEIKVTQQRYVFDVDANNTQIDYGGETATLDVKSSGTWTVSSDKDFVTVPSGDQPASRDNAKKCDIQVQPNYDAKTRTATLTFQTEHYDSNNAPHLRKTIEISQAAYEFEVNGNTSDFELVDIPAGGAVKTEISVKCSGSWDCEVEKDKEWLTVEKTKDGFTYTVAKNTKKDSRSATITVKAFKLDGKSIAKKITITIKQKGK